jgi:L-ascorbate metabolism protein UlaG (beta-lactamase superfamily)
MEYEQLKLDWLGHAGFRIKDSLVIYIDPFELQSTELKADIVLITHSHYDHCSLEALQKVCKSDTVIVGPIDVQSKIAKLGDLKFRMLKPGEEIELGKLKLTGFPAYNIGKHFHPKANEWLGYLIELDRKRIFHAGDTDAVPELKTLHDIDILLIPVGGTYTMNAEEAAFITNAIMPKVAVPMHWGSIVGSKLDAERFAQLARCRVELL